MSMHLLWGPSKRGRLWNNPEAWRIVLESLSKRESQEWIWCHLLSWLYPLPLNTSMLLRLVWWCRYEGLPCNQVYRVSKSYLGFILIELDQINTSTLATVPTLVEVPLNNLFSNQQNTTHPLLFQAKEMIKTCVAVSTKRHFCFHPSKRTIIIV